MCRARDFFSTSSIFDGMASKIKCICMAADRKNQQENSVFQYIQVLPLMKNLIVADDRRIFVDFTRLHLQKMKPSKALYFTIVTAVCVTTLIIVLSRPFHSDDVEVTRRAETNAVLSVCGDALNYWVAKHNRVPSVGEGLSVLKMQATPLDGWGRPIIFKKNGSRFQLYSPGKNGIDENGSGDDIVY